MSWFKRLSLGILLSSSLGIVGAVLLDVPKFYRLSEQAETVNGQIVAKERENHMSIRAEYAVDGKLFSVAGRSENIGKSFEDVRIGEPAPIYYSPIDPAISTLGDPSEYLRSSLIGIAFTIVGVATLLLIFLVKEAAKERKKKGFQKL